MPQATVDKIKEKLEQLYEIRMASVNRIMKKWNLPHNFEVLAYLGRGSFGQVRLVKFMSSERNQTWNRYCFALKSISKASMGSKTHEKIFAERDILIKCYDCPWIGRLFQSFQVKYSVKQTTTVSESFISG